MDNDITKHHKYIEKQITALSAQQKPDRKDVETLAQYHDMMTKNFQHERLIHLLVTLFFAVVTVISLAISAVFYYILLSNNNWAQDWILGLPAWFLSLILVTMEIFYVRFYYRLENRTQKLYKLTRQIYELMQ